MSVIHRNGHDPEAARVPLIRPFEIIDIASAVIRSDNEAIAITLMAADGTRLLLGLTPAMMDALGETITKTRKALTEAGMEPTMAFHPVNTAAVAPVEVEGRAFVSLIVDRSLPTAQAFLMPPKNARLVSRQLKSAAQVASSARAKAGEIEPPDPSDDGE